MKKVIKRYLNNSIKPEDIEQLRSLSDEDVAEYMRRDWENSLPVAVPMKSESLWKKVFLRTAIIIIPLLIVSTIIFWNRSNTLANQDVVVTTGPNGERASVTLPDGSTVELNSNSRLSYSPQGFLGDSRDLTLDGEGFFSVVKKEGKRFVVHSVLVDVEVTGTSFDLLTRSKENCASIYLESGEVEILANGTGQHLAMTPGQLAVFDAQSRNFVISNDDKPNNIAAWRIGECSFVNRPLSEVAKTLSSNYGILVSCSSQELNNIPFTGTLPTDNLQEAISILTISLSLKSNIQESYVTLSK